MHCCPNPTLYSVAVDLTHPTILTEWHRYILLVLVVRQRATSKNALPAITLVACLWTTSLARLLFYALHSVTIYLVRVSCLLLYSGPSKQTALGPRACSTLLQLTLLGETELLLGLDYGREQITPCSVNDGV